MRELYSEAVFVTADQFIDGKMMTAPRRFSDVLNDQTVSWITVFEVEVARPNKPWEIVATLPELVLVKAHILAAIIIEEPASENQRRFSHYSHRHREPQRLRVSIPPYEVEGVGYLDKVGNLHAMLFVEGRDFVPLTEASIVPSGDRDSRLHGDVILVNRRAICGLSSAEEVSEERET